MIRCQKVLCRSPIACGGFGYCRERNFDFPDARLIDAETIKAWQASDTVVRAALQACERK